MGRIDKRVDAYIANSQPFARPILEHVRALVHRACPDVVETIKWGMPSFEYKGPYFGFAAFKKHCSFGFWKGNLLKDPNHLLSNTQGDRGNGMGNFGKISDIKQLPKDKVILDFLEQAKKLNDDGVKVPRPKSTKTAKSQVPPNCLLDALKKDRAAHMHFEAFSPTKRSEYIEWINEAKTEPTRDRRVAQAVAWIAEGKSRNWKYERKK
jgi:uncharacterized protein YdeI (YjbR/CyaY-like superfamily)